MDQKPIKGTGHTALSLNEIRQKFESALGPASECTFLVLKDWLQAPVSDTGLADNLCDQRAHALAKRLNRNNKEPFEPKLIVALGSATFEKKWEEVDRHLLDNTIVILKGPAKAVGGTASVFKQSYHAMLLLSVRLEGAGKTGDKAGRKRSCYVGFDPDISATQESRDLWGKLVGECQTTNSGVKNLTAAQLSRIVKTMILGEGTTGVGPLIRKYYPDRTKGVGKVDRNF